MIVNSPCTIRTDCDNPSGAVSKNLLKINGAGKFVLRTLTTDPIDGICMETLPGSKMIVIVGNGLAEKFTGLYSLGTPGQSLIQATASTISAVATPATNDRIIGKVLGTSFGSQAGDGWIITCFDTSNGMQASGGSLQDIIASNVVKFSADTERTYSGGPAGGTYGTGPQVVKTFKVKVNGTVRLTADIGVVTGGTGNPGRLYFYKNDVLIDGPTDEFTTTYQTRTLDVLVKEEDILGVAIFGSAGTSTFAKVRNARIMYDSTAVGSFMVTLD